MTNELRQLQKTQVEILNEIDCVCKKNGIHYSLYAGTLLGAVRHGGFIPWDDDLDICMLRSEYEAFLTAWKSEEHSGYILQNKQLNNYYMNSFSKVRKDHTTFLEHEEDIGKFHTGVFVDIFPVDRMPNGLINRKIFIFYCMLYQLLTREYASKRDGLIIRVGCGILLACVPKKYRKKFRNRLLQKITSHSADKGNDIVFIESYKTMKVSFPANLFDDYTLVDFEGQKFMSILRWKEYLSRKYGDYSKLPPKEEQVWTHHPIVIDYEKNIEEIREQK